jgi:hypothetical protein
MKLDRRWFQVSLRGVLAAITALGLWLGCQAKRAHRQREATVQIEALGGSVQYDWQPGSVHVGFRAGRLEKFASPGGTGNRPGGLAKLIGPEYFQEVQAVVLRSQKGQFTIKPGDQTPQAEFEPLDPSRSADECLRSLIPQLQRLPELKQILVEFPPAVSDGGQNRFSDEALAALEAALPNCRVFKVLPTIAAPADTTFIQTNVIRVNGNRDDE